MVAGEVVRANSAGVTAVICGDGAWEIWDCYRDNILLWNVKLQDGSHVSVMATRSKQFELDLRNWNRRRPHACEQVACTVLFLTENHKYGDDANLCGWVQNL